MSTKGALVQAETLTIDIVNASSKPGESVQVCPEVVRRTSPQLWKMIQENREIHPAKLGLESEDVIFILKLTHSNADEACQSLNAGKLSAIAKSSRVLGLRGLLIPWFAAWFKPHLDRFVMQVYPPHRCLGQFILAAVDFRAAEQFSQLCAEAVCKLTCEEVASWQRDEILSEVPRKIREAIVFQISVGMQSIHSDITRLQGSLQDGNQAGTHNFYGMTSEHLAQHRDDKEHRPLLCDEHNMQREMRIVNECVQIFQTHKFWNARDWCEKLSMRELSYKIHAMTGRELKHKCQSGSKCQLVLQLEDLRERIDDMLDNTPMLKLEDYSL